MIATNDKESSAAGTDNRPHMLEESDFDSWKIRIERYIHGKPRGKLIWKSITNGPSPHPMITVTTGESKQQTQKETLFDQYERFRANGNELIHDYFVYFHKLINDLKINDTKIPTHQRNTKFLNNLPSYWGKNTKFLNNLPSYWGKYVTIIKNSKDISTASYVSLYTHLKSYEQHAMKTLSKINQTSGNADPLAYMAHATKSTSSPSQYVPPSPHGFQKQFPSTNNQLRTSTNPTTHATIQSGQITTESVKRKAPGNKGKQVATESQGKAWFKDKALLMEAKEKGVVLDEEAKAFLADVECTVPYAEPLAITTTTTFEVSHEDAYDSEVDEVPHAATVFMANLMQTDPSTGQGTNNQDSTFSEVPTYDNHFFDNLNHQ
nr:hypothetical protein [Tanacetum cinerariifolium]